jgi:hypothetical protein
MWLLICLHASTLFLPEMLLAKSHELHDAQLGWCGVGVETVTVSFRTSLLVRPSADTSRMTLLYLSGQHPSRVLPSWQRRQRFTSRDSSGEQWEDKYPPRKEGILGTRTAALLKCFGPKGHRNFG